MNVLLLNQTFYPDVVATAQVLSEAARALVERGHNVTVLTGRRAYDEPKRTFPARENWRGVRILRVGGTTFGKGARWRRALDFGSFMLGCAARLATMPRADVVVALTSPPLISVLAALFARWRRARFVYWVMDLNPDEAVAAGWLREGSAASRILERLSRFSFRRADAIVALDRFMAARIAAKGVGSSKIAVLPPWSLDETVRFDAAGREAFRGQHGLDGRFVVMYSGNHSPCHPLDTLLGAAEAMASDGRFVFLFVGGGSEFGRIQRLARERRLLNVKCLPYQPLERLSASLSAADLHVVVMGDRFVGTIHPCKIYNVLRVGAPVLYIGPQPSHLSELLDRLGAETCAQVAHGDVRGCVGEIRRIAALGQRGEPDRFEALAEEFSRARLVARFLSLVEGRAMRGEPALATRS